MRQLLIFIIYVSSQIAVGQINVGPATNAFLKFNKFAQKHLDMLKSSKTLFVYKESDLELLDELKQSISEVWNYSALEFISYDEYEALESFGTNSYFTIEGQYNISTSSSGTQSQSTHIYLALWMKNGKFDLNFCRIELFPTFPTIQKARSNHKYDHKIMSRFFYTESVFHNWNILYLKNALQILNKGLTESKEHYIFGSIASSNLSLLKSNTLYIPEYIMTKFSKFSGNEDQKHDEKDLFKYYPFDYKVVSMETLIDMLLNGDEPFYYLSYIKSSTDKYVTVLNSATAEMLYTDYPSVSFNIKSKDLRKLAIKIK